MTWKRKAYQVAAALEGTVSKWRPQGRQTFASLVALTDDGIFHACYSKCSYLSIGNNISDSYEGAISISVGRDSEGTDRFEVTYNHPRRQEVRRILVAFSRLKHPDFKLEEVLGSFPVSDSERMTWLQECHRALELRS
jgi:hypothetical protein